MTASLLGIFEKHIAVVLMLTTTDHERKKIKCSPDFIETNQKANYIYQNWIHKRLSIGMMENKICKIHQNGLSTFTH